MRRIIIGLMIVMLTGPAILAQHKNGSERQKQEVQMGRDMVLVTPGLLQIGSETNFFLATAEQIQLTDKQRQTLEEVIYEFQRDSVQRMADLKVAEAELDRLLSREQIDLTAVRAKISESEAITTDLKMFKFESLLKAIKILTHEQHLKILTLVRERPEPEGKPKIRAATE